MRTIAVTSAKASPGVTTASVALGAVWSDNADVVVVEADPSGGDLAARFGLSGSPGLVSLATAARRERAGDLLRQHSQTLPGGLAVVAAPPSAEQTRTALDILDAGVFVEGSPDATVILDVGRLDIHAPSWPLVSNADFVLICARPVLAEIHHLVSTTALISQNHNDVAIVLIGDGPYSSTDIAEVAKADVIGHVPFDRHGANGLAGIATSQRTLERSALLRSARALSEVIIERLSLRDAPTSNVGVAS